MANFNKVILAGYMTRDPQLSYTPSQTPVVDFGLAINRKPLTPGPPTRGHAESNFLSVFNHHHEKGRILCLNGK